MIGLKLGSEVALYSYDWTAEPLLGVLAAPVAPAIALAGCSASGDGSDGSFCFGFCAFGVGLLAGFAFLVGASFSLGSAAANPTTPYSLDTSANVPLSTSSSGSTVLKTSPEQHNQGDDMNNDTWQRQHKARKHSLIRQCAAHKQDKIEIHLILNKFHHKFTITQLCIL
eukprot:m.57542 g.57542  ORF g.57542 m.57542 type:complete len:169 (-) comp11605_c1_seq1:675-1181(-)